MKLKTAQDNPKSLSFHRGRDRAYCTDFSLDAYIPAMADDLQKVEYCIELKSTWVLKPRCILDSRCGFVPRLIPQPALSADKVLNDFHLAAPSLHLSRNVRANALRARMACVRKHTGRSMRFESPPELS
jgi:hypothetical protein